MDLFDYMRENTMEKESPLASRLRPSTLEEIVGQQHILGKDKMLQILDKYPEWKQAYLKEDSQEAKETFDYLLKLRDSQEK